MSILDAVSIKPKSANEIKEIIPTCNKFAASELKGSEMKARFEAKTTTVRRMILRIEKADCD